MDNQNIAELTDTIGRSKSAVSAETYELPITIVNASSVGFQKAEVAVKDEGTQSVATAYFGHISSGQTSTEYVHLPGGIEVCIWKILPDMGDEIYGVGMANNAGGVKLTISD